ncbi:MAG: hypothetical protein QOI53_3879 [Verrucomicrobiota bacterium]|nr:hypothetical protein [Verrucomicrobiota bacterium]
MLSLRDKSHSPIEGPRIGRLAAQRAAELIDQERNEVETESRVDKDLTGTNFVGAFAGRKVS